MALPEGAYNFNQTEKEILEFWLSNRFYKPEYNPVENRVLSTEEMKLKIKNSDSNDKWCLICPPPNAYARPHIGNISGYAYQDAMARYQRMKGKTVLMIPGKDHAGLEGEGVFVREVLEKQGRKKFDMTREEFYKEIWDFNMLNKEKALNDEKSIGLSADFDRDIFTLDPRIVNTVLNTFVDLYKEGMVYKGVRLINWDPKARSAIADNQCIREERDGKLYKIKYPIAKRRVWSLNFRDYKIFERIQNAEKTIETRALNPEENRRYFAEILTKDLIVCIDKSDKKSAPIYKKVKNLFLFKNIDDAFDKLDWKNVLGIDNASKTDVEKAYSNISNGYLEKINANGLVAIELEDLNEEDFIAVATTRPETMFGDTAIAVNPEDARYSDFVGKKVVIPLTDIEIPVITSPRVLTDFGTGALKITPAHSSDDFQIMNEWLAKGESPIGYRNVIDKDLKLSGSATGKYLGMKYKDALPLILEDLKMVRLYEGEETIKQNVLISERTKALVEPLMSSQWFISVEKFKQPVIDMVKNGEVRIHPQNMEDKFFNWMNNLRDWAISRSLWWGYRMPVWYAGEVKEEISESGEVKEFIKLSSSETKLSLGRGTIDQPMEGENFQRMQNKDSQNIWVPLDYSNPQHIQVSLFSPDSFKVDFIRHAEAEHNREKSVAGITDTDLTEKGISDAEHIVESLKGKYDLIITSSKKRASNTAAIIGKKLNIPVIENSLIVERDFGSFEKRYWKDILNEFPEIEPEKITTTDNIYGAETSESVKKRIREFFVEIEKKYLNKRILVITHAVLLKYIKNETGVSGQTEEMQNLEIYSAQISPKNSTWIQDSNVLDTWFSSGQWPYATLMAHDLMDIFFPTNVLETGFDILENWVSRMMMFSWFKLKQIPFKDVYLHGLVQGPDGQKMAKSRGNIVDIDKVSAEYGRDAVRLVYFYQNTAGASYSFTIDKLKNFKQFNNKLWNAAKFVLQNFEQVTGNNIDLVSLESINKSNNPFVKQIMEHSNTATAQVIKNMENFQFGLATFNLYQMFWHTFCDKYIEESKKFLGSSAGEAILETDKKAVASAMLFALKQYLKLLHPFIPFITERIWQEVPKHKDEHRALMFNKID